MSFLGGRKCTLLNFNDLGTLSLIMIALIANEKTAATHVGSLVRPCSFDSNVYCESLSRNVKYENIYLNQHDTVRQLQTGLTASKSPLSHTG